MGRQSRTWITGVLFFGLGACGLGGTAEAAETGRGGDCEPAWTLVSTPNATEEASALAALAVLTKDSIWAAGSYVQGKARHTLTQHWDGGTWRIVPSPDGALPLNLLSGIAAVSADDIWVTGYSTDGFIGEVFSETLIEHWDGRAWSVVPSPNLTPADVSEEFGGYPVKNELFAVAAVSQDDVWAVGRSYTIVRGQELIIHWDGARWSVVPSPHPGVSGWLRSVVVVSSRDVWALGEYYGEVPIGEGATGSVQQNLIEHWDGSSWSVVPSPNLGPSVNGIMGAAAVSANDIWAVGIHLDIFGVGQVYQPTILHWDGAEWSAIGSPFLTPEHNYLFAVSALSTDDVFAVGFYDTGPPSPELHTLVEHWNGVAWNVVPTQDPGQINELTAVAAVGPDDVWAVGQAFVGEFPYGSLIERYASSCLDASFLRGDSNADGAVDLADAVTTLGYLFLGGETPRCIDSLDADDNGAIEITDAIYVLGFLFQGGPQPAQPYPAPGPDPTPVDPYEC